MVTDPTPPAMRMPDGELVLVAGGTPPFVSGSSSGLSISKIGFKAGGAGKLQAYSKVTGQFVKLSKFQEAAVKINSSSNGQFIVGVAQGLTSGLSGVDMPEAITKSQAAGQFVGKALNTVVSFFQGR